MYDKAYFVKMIDSHLGQRIIKELGDNMDVIVRRYQESDYESVNQLLYNTFGYHKEKMSDDRIYEFVLL